MATWEATQSGTRLHELEQRLKRAGRGDLHRKLRSSVKQTAKPVEGHLKSAVMGVTLTRGSDPYSRRPGASQQSTPQRSRSTGLRARTARAIGTSVTRKGVRIRVSERKFGPYGKSLPRYLDGELNRYRRLRHPVFGNREVWVEHIGKRWFFVTIRRDQPLFHRAVDTVMTRTLVDLTK